MTEERITHFHGNEQLCKERGTPFVLAHGTQGDRNQELCMSWGEINIRIHALTRVKK